MHSNVVVISRDEIPAIQAVEQDGQKHELGDHRDFSRHPVLKDFIPSNARLGMSWASLRPNQVLEPHLHPIASMILVCSGTGRLLGDRESALKAGDAVLVGPGCLHGFMGGEPDGIQVLSVQFEEGSLYEDTARPKVSFSADRDSLEALLAYNSRRLEELIKLPYFRLILSDELDDPAKREMLFSCLHAWSRHFQTILYTRQATCLDESYREAFLTHMKEESGHDELLAHGRERAPLLWDPVIEAISAWFVSRMHLLDNVEKAAIVHLVLESSGAYFHEIAPRAMRRFGELPYFEAHLGADDDHADLGVALLRDLTPQTYARLRVLLGQAWDMFTRLLERITELVNAAATAPAPAVHADRGEMMG